MSGLANVPGVRYGATPRPHEKYPLELLQAWAKAINEERVTDLTPWETEFMESISGKLERGWALSDKQILTLERIYADKTA